MEEEIINRVAKSPLVVFDLEDYYPEGIRKGIDLSDWLWEGLILREKEFRAVLLEQDWSQYQDYYIYLYCSTDAIIPAWSYSLVTMYLTPFAKKIIIGSEDNLNTMLYQEILAGLDYSIYQDKPLIIKGCSKKAVPENALVMACQYLQPVARSIMFGEACSTVPLYKKSSKK